MNFDNEVLAYLSTRKDELMQQHDEYIAEHTEIREVLNDFLSSVLLHKPVSLQLHAIIAFNLPLLITCFVCVLHIYRMMSSSMPRSISTHSIRLLSKISH